MILLSLIFLFWGANCFRVGPISGSRTPLRMSSEEGVVKLPIVQIIENNVITGEFVMGGALERNIAMFVATIEGKHKELQGDSDTRAHGVDNVYSDEHLRDIFAREGVIIVLKIHRIGCKKCALFEQKFYDAAKKYKFPDGSIKWITADIADVPEHAQSVKDRLLGGSGSS